MTDAKRKFPIAAMIAGALLILVGLLMAFRDWQVSSSAASGEPIVMAVTATRTLVPTFTPGPKITPSPEAPDLLPKFPGAESPERANRPAPKRSPSATRANGPQPTATAATETVLAATEPPDRLAIPSIELDALVLKMGWRVTESDGQQVSEWIVPDNAVGWHKNSALPGHDENVVMSGHHNVKGEVFRYLADVKVGDKINLYVGSDLFPYHVTETYILKEKGQPLAVRIENARFMRPTGDERLTLISCWPYSNNTHRVIVVAKPLDWTARSQIHGADQ